MTEITNPKWADQACTMVAADIDGVPALISADAANAMYAAILREEIDIAAYEPPAPTGEDVIAERNRRLAGGFDFDFGDERGVHRIGTTVADLAGWSEVTDYARALAASGDTETTIGVVTDTGPCEVTAAEWESVLLAAAAFRQPIWAASFALAAADPIPADYADDGHWPA
jgi:hypothetical protein